MYVSKFIQDLRGVPRIIQKLEHVVGGIVDPNGFGFLNLMFENASVPQKYRYMFFPNNSGEVFIDCGMNVGLITDIARKMDMEVYGFEPNPLAIRLFNKKYANDDKVHIYPCAISDNEGEMDFYSDPKCLFDQGASIIKNVAKIEGGGRLNNSVKVKVKKLTDIIKNNILIKHEHIHLLKMDIEGAEFGVLNDIIDEQIYKNITYIVVETHEMFFNDGKIMLKRLKNRIKENNIENIYLDRI